MMFGVVVCPNCGRAKGVEIRKATTACQCGFTIRVQRSKVRFETSDARELASAVGRINAKIHGEPEDAESIGPKPERLPRDAFARIVDAASRAGDRRQRVRVAAEELAREFVVFSLQDWRRVLASLDIPNPDLSLQELVRSNVVYEPKPGFFRTV